MSPIRSTLALAVLVAAALPLRAQGGTVLYDAGSFTLQVPPGMAMLRNHATNAPNTRSERFMGGNERLGMVMVVHSTVQGVPQDPRLRSVAGTRPLLRDSATVRAAIGSPRDTSRALDRELHRELGDTTLAHRRQLLLQSREVFRSGSRTMTLPAEASEVVTENRITLRSPVSVSLGADMAPLQGTADVSIPRRGDAEVWVVMYVNAANTPGVAATAARVLDTFRITGGPTTAPLAP